METKKKKFVFIWLKADAKLHPRKWRAFLPPFEGEGENSCNPSSVQRCALKVVKFWFKFVTMLSGTNANSDPNASGSELEAGQSPALAQPADRFPLDQPHQMSSGCHECPASVLRPLPSNSCASYSLSRVMETPVRVTFLLPSPPAIALLSSDFLPTGQLKVQLSTFKSSGSW
jgi:hypothetical protein